MSISQGDKVISSLKRGRKRVHFSKNQVESSHEDCNGPLSAQESQMLWYQRPELAQFKLEVRDYALGINRERQESRGLEKYESMERHQRKAMSRKCVLLAIQKGMREQDVATIAQRCSASAVKEAFVLGLQDYCRAHDLQLQQDNRENPPAVDDIRPAKKLRVC